MTTTATAIEAYPYRTWIGLTRQERWQAMLATGYHPGSGQRLSATPGTRCGDCRWLAKRVFEPEEGVREAPRTMFVCTMPVMLADLLGNRQVRKKWPGCRSWSPE